MLARADLPFLGGGGAEGDDPRPDEAHDRLGYALRSLTVAGMMRMSPPTWKTRLWMSAAAMARSVGSSAAACSSSETLSGQSPTVPPCRCGWANPSPK